MSHSAFPGSIEPLTSEWLSRALTQAGVLQEGSVSGIKVEPLPGGYTSSLYRVLPEYEGGTGPCPSSLIVKVHGDSALTRSLFEELNIFEKEVRFYQALAGEEGLPLPVCYAAEFDPGSRNFVILMEDLSAARPGSYDEHALGDVRTALTHLAKLHARFWGDPKLQQYNWIVDQTNLDNPPPAKQLWIENHARVNRQFRDLLSDYTWSVCDKWLNNWDAIMSCMSQDTHTLVHTDAHLGQMFFPTAELPRFVLFDWQYPSKGWGSEDVVHTIVASLEVEVRREHEVALIDHYYDSLCEHGVSKLSRERFWFQCRLSLLWFCFMEFNVVAQPELLKTLQAEAEEAGDDWHDWVFGELDAAVQDWKLAEALDQAIEEGDYLINAKRKLTQ